MFTKRPIVLQRLLAVVVLLACASSPVVAQDDLSRTAWGSPDLQGVWDYRTLTDGQDGRDLLTDEEGLIIDPPDGRVPPLTPEEAERRAAIAAARRGLLDHEPTPGGWLEDLGLATLQVRCITGFGAGPPMTPGSQNSFMQLFQTEDAVVILSEVIHSARIIPLDGRPHGTLRQYSGDSRGRWDGDTLVVTTVGFSHPTAFLRGRASRDLRVTERFTLASTDLLIYRATMDDPATWTRPWTFEVSMTRSTETIHEYACHEGNDGLYDVLATAARRDSRAFAGEVAGGYQFVQDYELGENFPSGWFVSAAHNLNRRLAVVGEVSGSEWSETNPNFDLTATVNVVTYLGGMRFRGGVGSLSPFAQVLAGAARARATLSGFGTTVSESETALTIQPGGGVDVRVSATIAARAMVDYRRISFADQGTNQIRLAVGVVVGIGGN